MNEAQYEALMALMPLTSWGLLASMFYSEGIRVSVSDLERAIDCKKFFEELDRAIKRYSKDEEQDPKADPS